MSENAGRVAVVVLGGLGQSPRMQYHALSLAQQAQVDVDVIAFEGSDPHVAVLKNPSIHLHRMRHISFKCLPSMLRLLLLPVQAMIQLFVLLWFLCIKIPCPDAIIAQNPPSVPTLIAVKLASWWRGSSFIVDWHNFGYSILGLSLGRSHFLVKFYCWLEKCYGMKANASLCVTRAMQQVLAQNWGIKASVLYDKPPDFFRPSSLPEKHELYCRLNGDICHPPGTEDCISFGGLVDIHQYGANNTLVSSKIGDEISLKLCRPAVVVSSTSWTPDEDFEILIQAAVMYDRRVSAVLNEDDSVDDKMIWMEIVRGRPCMYPRLLFIITGKGPEREKYERKIKKLHLRRVAFRMLWLSAEDYQLLLGSADLGVCLHTSSSGLDLPMKIVDMFGCGLPVCAASYSCIGELVNVGNNGLLFSSPSELADELLLLFKGFPDANDVLQSLREGALSIGASGCWTTEWEYHALPLIAEVISKKGRSLEAQ